MPTKLTIFISVLCAALLPAASGRADVTITPGVIHGTVTLTLPAGGVTPTSMRLDAVNPPSEATQYPSTQMVNAPDQVNGSVSVWSYSVTVESALTHTYYVRPVFYTANQSQTETAQFAAPPFAAPSMPANGDVTFSMAYQPAAITGSTGLTDSGNPLPGQSFFFIAHDIGGGSQIFPDSACGPSIGSNCLSNSTVRTQQGTYSLYLQPNDQYLLQQSFSWADPNAAQAQGAYVFDFNIPYTSAGPGSSTTRDENFSQLASVSGNISIDAQPLSQVQIFLGGNTQNAQQFGSQYMDFYLNGATSTSYDARVFSDAVLPQDLSLLVDVSFLDGSSVQAPRITLSNVSGDVTQDYSGSTAHIVGTLAFNPPRALSAVPHTSIAHIGSNNFGASTGYLTAAANGGTFSLPVIPDDSGQPYFFWQFPGLAFDLGPNFTSDYVINDLSLTPNLIVTPADIGKNVSAGTITLDTAFVDVFFTAAPGTLISDPFVDSVLFDQTLGLYETGHGEGLNQNAPAQQAEARLILRASGSQQPVVVTPSAMVLQNGNSSRASFSPFSVVPTPGGVIKVAPPLVLSVSSPTEGQQFDVCSIPVIGTAGGAPILKVTIDGSVTGISPSPIAGDSNRVGFSQTITGVQGPNTISITATDTLGDSVTQDVHVSCAVHNQPPAIVCPQAVTNACGSNAGANQTLTAQVSDADDSSLHVNWSVDGVPVKTDTVALSGGAGADSLAYTFSDASHVVQASVSDGVNPPQSCTTTVTISKDATPPNVSATVNAALLWPPNHDLINVGLTVSDSDSCDPSPSTGAGVYSNESDQEETGSGNFSPDAKNIAAGTLRLRSERKGNGDGRVYLIIGTGTDHNGDEGFDCATVVVPHDQSAASITQVNAMASAARAYCKTSGAAPAGYVPVGVGPVVGPKQ